MDLINRISDGTKELIFRIISWLLSSFLFFSVLPIFMFVIYMREKLIFSYDLFTSGLFGINVFFIYGILIILIFAIAMTSSLFVGIAWFTEAKCKKNSKIDESPRFCKYQSRDDKDTDKKKNKGTSGELIFLFLAFLAFNILVITGIWLKDSKLMYELLFFVLISAILTLHFAIVVFMRAKYSIFSLLFFFPLSIVLLYTNGAKTAEIVSLGLRSFNSAQKEVTIRDMNNTPIINGTLLLLSPENIYVHTQENNETNRTKIINRNNIIIDIKN